MLAPRKKLWSTPPNAIPITTSLVGGITSNDVVFDVGCGDGRVLIALALGYLDSNCNGDKRPSFIGIEIDEDRANEARGNILDAGLQELISITTTNAMNVDYSEATIIFLYLVPRGLRLIKPIILQGRNSSTTTSNGSPPSGGKGLLKVVTYMAGFIDEKYIEKRTVSVEHQDGAAWPIYLFHFGVKSIEGGKGKVEMAGSEKRGEQYPFKRDRNYPNIISS